MQLPVDSRANEVLALPSHSVTALCLLQLDGRGKARVVGDQQRKEGDLVGVGIHVGYGDQWALG